MEKKHALSWQRGWQTRALYIPQSPRIKQALYQRAVYERTPKLILPLLFTEQILTVWLQFCCLWNKNDGVNATVSSQSRTRSASDNVSVQLSTVDNGRLPVWSPLIELQLIMFYSHYTVQYIRSITSTKYVDQVFSFLWHYRTSLFSLLVSTL